MEQARDALSRLAERDWRLSGCLPWLAPRAPPQLGASEVGGWVPVNMSFSTPELYFQGYLR
jgi:hypothetical protein